MIFETDYVERGKMMKSARKILSVFLSLVLMCTAWLPPVSAATANEVNDSKVYMADELSTAAKEYLANYGIPINNDSRFILSTASNNTRSSTNSASNERESIHLSKCCFWRFVDGNFCYHFRGSL